MSGRGRNGPFEALHEDDDDWLQGYLATTEYGSDTKLTSNPVRPKKETSEKKAYKMQPPPTNRSSRRKSWAVTQTAKVVPRVECLPDRVNAIRSAVTAEVAPPAGHFVREHRKSKEHPAEEFVAEGSRKAARSGIERIRRGSLDYDELDAVKQRVMQAAQVWEQKETEGEDSEEHRDDLVPASALMSAKTTGVPKVDATDKKLSGKSWLLGRWSKLSVAKA